MVSKKLIVATMTCVKKGKRLGADLEQGLTKLDACMCERVSVSV